MRISSIKKIQAYTQISSPMRLKNNVPKGSILYPQPNTSMAKKELKKYRPLSSLVLNKKENNPETATSS